MDIARKPDTKTVDASGKKFTCKVTFADQFARPDPSRVSGAIVYFKPGARTAGTAIR